MIACPWTSAVECALAAERGAAGTSDYCQPCPEHRAPPEEEPLDAFLAAARLEADFLDPAPCPSCGGSREGSDWPDGRCDDCHLDDLETVE